jgi:hypothetical protein
VTRATNAPGDEDPRRKFHTAQKRRWRLPPELAGLEREQLDERNARIWHTVFSTMRELANVPEGHEHVQASRGLADRAYRNARAAAVLVCRDTYGVPWSRIVELVGCTPPTLAVQLRPAREPDSPIADLVARWPSSPGPQRVERQDTTQTDITLEAAQALQELCSLTGHHPLTVVSAAVLAARGLLQGDV